MISYERYTELLSKNIQGTITTAEEKDVAQFVAAQPKTCPECGAALFSRFMPHQVAHDVAKCDRKMTGAS